MTFRGAKCSVDDKCCIFTSQADDEGRVIFKEGSNKKFALLKCVQLSGFVFAFVWFFSTVTDYVAFLSYGTFYENWGFSLYLLIQKRGNYYTLLMHAKFILFV